MLLLLEIQQDVHHKENNLLLSEMVQEIIHKDQVLLLLVV